MVSDYVVTLSTETAAIPEIGCLVDLAPETLNRKSLSLSLSLFLVENN